MFLEFIAKYMTATIKLPRGNRPIKPFLLLLIPVLSFGTPSNLTTVTCGSGVFNVFTVTTLPQTASCGVFSNAHVDSNTIVVSGNTISIFGSLGVSTIDATATSSNAAIARIQMQANLLTEGSGIGYVTITESLSGFVAGSVSAFNFYNAGRTIQATSCLTGCVAPPDSQTLAFSLGQDFSFSYLLDSESIANFFNNPTGAIQPSEIL